MVPFWSSLFLDSLSLCLGCCRFYLPVGSAFYWSLFGVFGGGVGVVGLLFLVSRPVWVGGSCGCSVFCVVLCFVLWVVGVGVGPFVWGGVMLSHPDTRRHKNTKVIPNHILFGFKVGFVVIHEMFSVSLSRSVLVGFRLSPSPATFASRSFDRPAT